MAYTVMGVKKKLPRDEWGFVDNIEETCDAIAILLMESTLSQAACGLAYYNPTHPAVKHLTVATNALNAARREFEADDLIERALEK